MNAPVGLDRGGGIYYEEGGAAAARGRGFIEKNY